MEFFQERFVDFTECVPVRIIFEVDLVDQVNELTDENTVLHVLVRILEHCPNHGLTERRRRGDRQRFEDWEEFSVEERQQFLTGLGASVFSVGRPRSPAEMFGDDRLVGGVVELPVGFFRVVDLEEQQPGELGDALGVAVDPGVSAHDLAGG